ncbi:hypothetical protein SS1G_03531 [Sclerotinia sclerotiorum 1980 UF-70]|uniref:AB hydrolase-1 domain-containing protein n=1 Tax=Sclerotinia sclerotiorum (strain ATCC 18683 / 1980 / Ss-1) TaxID=665079 RepID=A7EDZ1_SCLS1|nr:hypothetical protein SS1G_03531 [Sclerotinia sclerotiorum 1980 UF-70]EDO01057.1 hypothetical protein SS1G_03531 [Sclerotinia sclerotiorum 1980 UF-70]
MSPPLPPLPLPDEITSTYIPTLNLTYHILRAGNPSHPLLLLLHGFPELAFSWRKLMPLLASSGYHVVAPDQRGCGRTTGWDTRAFSSVDLNSTTLVRLEYRVVIMSHPFKGTPILPTNTSTTNPTPASPTQDIHEALAHLPSPRKHYKWYYSTPTAATEMDNPKSELLPFLRGYFYLKSGHWTTNTPHPLTSWTASELQYLPPYYIMPLHSSMREVILQSMQNESSSLVQQSMNKWLTNEELSVYVDEYSRTGFQGMLNWYRVITDPYWMKDTELFAGRKIDVPLLFISGEKDWGMFQEPGVLEKMEDVCLKFRGVKVLEGAGHWVQQERAEEVAGIMERFLRGVTWEGVAY